MSTYMSAWWNRIQEDAVTSSSRWCVLGPDPQEQVTLESRLDPGVLRAGSTHCPHLLPSDRTWLAFHPSHVHQVCTRFRLSQDQLFWWP